MYLYMYLCFYDIALWTSFHKSHLAKFKSCYNTCVKYFFGYRKYDSMTNALLETGLPSFETVIHNAQCVFHASLCCSQNLLVVNLLDVKSSVV